MTIEEINENLIKYLDDDFLSSVKLDINWLSSEADRLNKRVSGGKLAHRTFYSFLLPFQENVMKLLCKFHNKKIVFLILVCSGLRNDVKIDHFYKFLRTIKSKNNNFISRYEQEFVDISDNNFSVGNSKNSNNFSKSKVTMSEKNVTSIKEYPQQTFNNVSNNSDADVTSSEVVSDLVEENTSPQIKSRSNLTLADIERAAFAAKEEEKTKKLAEASLNGQEVAVIWKQDEYRYLHRPKRLFWLTDIDPRYPKQFPSSVLGNREKREWRYSPPILISDENEIYEPKLQLPIIDSYSLGPNMTLENIEYDSIMHEEYLSKLERDFMMTKHSIHGRKISS